MMDCQKLSIDACMHAAFNEAANEEEMDNLPFLQVKNRSGMPAGNMYQSSYYSWLIESSYYCWKISESSYYSG